MSRLQAAKKLVEHALDCPAGDFTRCATFQGLVEKVAAGHEAIARR
ncbi:MAG TPA: hypothetical protein VGR23_06785 [Candidatus Dormibacteraeota bacterium]|jgi:hypothetical protein|nr:hypothetical protein [Candidatus Dormibacteraeota bacterium]